MTQPSNSDYLLLNQAIYTSGSAPVAPPGWALFTDASGSPLFTSLASSGLQAAAFKNLTTGQIVITYEGTNLGNITANPLMFQAQASADSGISRGSTPHSDLDALAFANQVSLAAGGSPIFVTGHSLGGEEAEYVDNAASQTGSNLTISGGATFGAPGVPSQSATSASGFINYIDSGDGVGSFSPSNGARVGATQFVGTTSDSATETSLLLSSNPANQLAGIMMGLSDHGLNHYAADFGVSLPATQQGANTSGVADAIASPAVYFTPLFGGTGDTVSSDGSVLTVKNSSGQLLDAIGQDTNGNTDLSFYDPTRNDALVKQQFLNPGNQSTATTQYNSDGSATTKVYNPANGVVVEQDTINTDGTMLRQFYDPISGAWLGTGNYDKTGNVVSPSFSDQITSPQFAGIVANVLAGQVIAHFLLKHDLPASVAAQSFAKAGIDSLVSEANGGTATAQTFSEDFAANITSMAGGILGADEGVALFKSLGLPSQLGGLVGGAIGGVATVQLAAFVAADILGVEAVDVSATFGASIAEGTLTAAAFAAQIGAAFEAAGFAVAGSMLEQALFTNKVGPGAEIGGAAGAAIGYYFGGPPGAFIGDFIGSAIGGLFGANPSVGPNATALVRFNSSTNQFYLAESAADNGGDVTIAQGLATALANSLNAVVSATGGTVAYSGLSPVFGLGYFKGQSFSADENDGNPNEYQQNQFANPNDAVSNAAFRMLHEIHISGGNPYMEYALQHSDASTFSALLSDLNTARDYSAYELNPIAFDASIAMSGDPTQLANWRTELARAHTLGLDQLTSGQLQSLTAFGTTIQLNAGSTVNVSGDTINAVANIGFTVNGGSNAINGTTGDTITVSGGTSDIVTITGGNSTVTDTNSGDTIWVESSGNTVTAANATVHLNSGVSNNVIAGNNDTLDLGSNVSFFDSGANVSVNASNSSGDLIQVLNNSSLTISGGSSNTVALDGTGSVVTDNDSGDSVWLNNPGNTAHTSNNNVFLNGGATTGAVTGSGDTITVLNSGSLTVSGGTSNTVNINGLNATLTDTNQGDTIHLNAGSTVNASGETITAVANIGFHVNGGGDAVTGTIGDTIFIGGNGQAGPTDTVAASNATVSLADNARADIAGSNNAVIAGQNDLVTILSGTGNTVNMNGINSVVTDTASGDTIHANANNDTVNASHDTISINANTSGVTINGSGDTITPADNAAFTVNGTAETLALGTAATVIATKVAYNSTTDQDQFIRDTATGQIAVDKFNSSGALTGGNALTNSNGSAFTLPTGSIIVAGAQNFLGHSGHDIIVESSTGALSVDEFNAAGALLTSTPIIHSFGAGGGAVTLTPGTQVLGTLSNYMGDGGTDLIYQTPDHGITLYEIGTNGQVIDGFYVNNNDASNTPYIAPTTLQLIGTGNNTLQAGGSDLIFQEPNGTILPLEMAYYGTIEAGGPATLVGSAQNFLGTGGADKIIALNSNQDLVVLEYNAAGNVVAGKSLNHSSGGVLSMGSGALVVGSAQNDFNLGGKDLIFWTTDGHLTNYEFNTSTGKIIDGFYLNNTSYQPLTFAAGTTVLGVAQNFLGHSGSDFFIKSPTGVVTAYEYTGYGTVGWTQAETLSNGTAAVDTFSGSASALNHNVISNFDGLNDKIDITGHAFNGTTSVTYTAMAGTNNQTGTLTISDSAGTIDTVELIGGNNIASFHVASDGNGGILVTDPPAGSTDGEASTLANLMKSGEDRFVFADAHVALQSAAHELFGQSPGAQAPAHESFAAISTNGDQFIFHASMMTMPQPSSSDLFDLPGVGQNPQQAELSHHLAQFGADLMQPFAHTLPDVVGAGTDPAHPDNHLLALHAHDGFHLS